MADLTVTPVKVKPLPTSIRRDFIAGGSGNVGDFVYVDSNGKVQQADASAAGTVGTTIGIVVSASSFGSTAFVSGDAVSVVVLGPVTGFSSLTPGSLAYASDTAGAAGSTAGTVSHKVGMAISAEILYVVPTL